MSCAVVIPVNWGTVEDIWRLEWRIMSVLLIWLWQVWIFFSSHFMEFLWSQDSENPFSSSSIIWSYGEVTLMWIDVEPFALFSMLFGSLAECFVETWLASVVWILYGDDLSWSSCIDPLILILDICFVASHLYWVLMQWPVLRSLRRIGLM